MFRVAQRFGYPYLLNFLDDSVSHLFPYNEPRSSLTFWWFKHNVICRAQPWICNEDGDADSTTSPPKRDVASKIDVEQFAGEILNKIGCTIC
ncbi:uncharacterized protein LOC142340869 isoform X3 [Convolutriloba macropyga]|uniref:uncharacterized protein LOC142340869 isoform X3 n=1 Tax=Convolutriloba macropyga TaxID=536237 RepID=UPI003F51B69F